MSAPHGGHGLRSIGRLAVWGTPWVAWEGALAVALLAWHGKHQTAGVVCPGTGKPDAGSSLHVIVGAAGPPLVA
nr:MAG TPA: hypothetical protein [Caudoviricetes sp.]